ncbi:MAG: hypothetical protein Greene041619_456 [Candidatus Peregrinibacteria bacterium Greene0416_19]|nr:MAG: hypothetical protein Greene041619_456 [Candidatus Peregrinibacteria bacterium Greene0416_19]
MPEPQTSTNQDPAGQNPASAGSQQGGQTAVPMLPEVLEGGALYDQIMTAIEPELTSTVYPTLAEKYKDETPEQAKVRAERYAKAMEEYKKQLQKYGADFGGKVRTFQHGVRKSMEADDRNRETSNMSGLEDAISNL